MNKHAKRWRPSIDIDMVMIVVSLTIILAGIWIAW
jgi:hypothetical protein